VKFEIRLADGTRDAFYERREPENPKDQEMFHRYWFEGRQLDNGSLAVDEMEQLCHYDLDAAMWRHANPKQRRRVAFYRPNSWVSYATVEEV
jgi:hypothetical protein